MSVPMSQNPSLGDGRHIKRDVSRRTLPRDSTSRGEDMKAGALHAAAAAAGTMGPPRHRTAEDEKLRAAARQAEREMWERTRGAGSSVFKLADSGRIKKGEPEEEWKAEDILPSLEDIESKVYEIVEVPSVDVLLSRGICDYTLLPKTLGRGKFSTVFMASKNGELSAIKHTALFPHHQLISTRLLREPTLLAELPPHPNLVAVKETIRTPGHFYLVEEYLGGYVTLEALIPMLSQSQPAILPLQAAEKILSQLISAVHSIHVPLQICHRDIKPENILVHPETLQLKLLDFGLATHYSKSEPKLSTCCGSPAFHCPEIVRALANPPGSVTYMGPEVDAWTCGVTMLRCLTGQRFPLGASHSSMRGMAIRAQRAVASIADESMRNKISALLDMDGPRRMKRFEELVAEQEKVLGEPSRETKKFKSTTFIPIEPTHSIRLPLLAQHLTTESSLSHASGLTTPHLQYSSASRRTTPASSRQPSPVRSQSETPLIPDSANTLASDTIVALNPTSQPPERVLSFVKYCLRCAGILYHSWPDISNKTKEGSGSPLGYFNGRASQSQTSLHLNSTGFAEALGSTTEPNTPSQPHFSPVTPLFPSFHEPEERSDGFTHVQIFQCVVEVSDDKAADESSGEQLTLVQSIMAAFGRKKTVEVPTSPRPANKRSLSTPAQARAKEVALAPGTPNVNTSHQSTRTKDGNVKSLAFYIVVKFPKVNAPSLIHHTPAAHANPRMTISRTTSSLSLGQQAATNSFTAHGRHSRANSGAKAFPLMETSLMEEDGTFKQNGKHINFHASQDTVKGVKTSPIAEGTHLEINTDLSLHPSMAALASPRNHHSPSSSRATSRTRKRSHRGSQKKPRIIIKVSDSRATQTIRDALSVGGSIDSLDELDYFNSNHHHRHSHPVARTIERDSEVRTPTGVEARDGKGRDSTPVGRVVGQGKVKESINAEGSRTIKSYDGEEYSPRGRQLGDTKSREHFNAKTSKLRAPSQISALAVQEESPSGGDLKQAVEALSLTLQSFTSLSSALTPEVTITSPSSSIPNSGQGSSDAATSSPSANSSLSITSSTQKVGYSGTETSSQSRARTLLMEILTRLNQAEKSGPSALEDLISPVSFALFAALSPALGIDPQEITDLPNARGAQISNVGDTVTLRGLAMSSLEILARFASPREMFMATQERLEAISNSRTAREVEDDNDVEESTSNPVIPSNKTWSSALEVSGLLQFLEIVIPRIQTQRPVNFVRSLTNLIPRALQASLRLQNLDHLESLDDISDPSQPSNSTPRTPESESSNRDLQDVKMQDRFKPVTRELTLGLTRFILSVKTWYEGAEKNEAETAKIQIDKLFFGSIIVLIPHIAKLDQGTNISTLYFRQIYPQYSFQNPKRQSASDNGQMLVQNSSHQSIWQILEEVMAKTSIDLEQYAFQKAQSGSSVNAEVSSAAAIVTMGAFILHVHLQFHLDNAYEQWTQEASMSKLKKAMPILLASLGSGPPATISADGMNALGGTANLSDASLSWLMWCVRGINRDDGEKVTIAELDILAMIQMLSSHAALSPNPTSRLISITLVETILTRNVASELGREILRDLIIESPFPQLKSASVGLAKRLVASDRRGKEKTYATKEMLNMISDVVFQSPAPGPNLEEYDFTASKIYLDDNGAWIGECLSFIYFIASMDRSKETSLLDEESITSIRTNLLAPLKTLIKQIDTHTTSTASKEEAELALQASLLAVGLDRADDILNLP